MTSKRQIAINNKRRGKQFEADVVKEAKEFGFESIRAWGSDGRALGLKEDVDLKIVGLTFQCKRKKRLPKWMKFEEHLSGVLCREDNSPALAIIPLQKFLSLIALITNEQREQIFPESIAEGASPPRLQERSEKLKTKI